MDKKNENDVSSSDVDDEEDPKKSNVSQELCPYESNHLFEIFLIWPVVFVMWTWFNIRALIQLAQIQMSDLAIDRAISTANCQTFESQLIRMHSGLIFRQHENITDNNDHNICLLPISRSSDDIQFVKSIFDNYNCLMSPSNSSHEISTNHTKDNCDSGENADFLLSTCSFDEMSATSNNDSRGNIVDSDSFLSSFYLNEIRANYINQEKNVNDPMLTSCFSSEICEKGMNDNQENNVHDPSLTSCYTDEICGKCINDNQEINVHDPSITSCYTDEICGKCINYNQENNVHDPSITSCYTDEICGKCINDNQENNVNNLLPASVSFNKMSVAHINDRSSLLSMYSSYEIVAHTDGNYNSIRNSDPTLSCSSYNMNAVHMNDCEEKTNDSDPLLFASSSDKAVAIQAQNNHNCIRDSVPSLSSCSSNEMSAVHMNDCDPSLSSCSSNEMSAVHMNVDCDPSLSSCSSNEMSAVHMNDCEEKTNHCDPFLSDETGVIHTDVNYNFNNQNDPIQISSCSANELRLEEASLSSYATALGPNLNLLGSQERNNLSSHSHPHHLAAVESEISQVKQRDMGYEKNSWHSLTKHNNGLKESRIQQFVQSYLDELQMETVDSLINYNESEKDQSKASRADIAPRTFTAANTLLSGLESVPLRHSETIQKNDFFPKHFNTTEAELQHFTQRPARNDKVNKETLRNKVCQELMETERRFCSCLWTLLELHAESIKASNCVPLKDLCHMFPKCLPRLYEVHSSFLSQLEQSFQIDTTTRYLHVANIVVELLDANQGELFQLYRSYVADFKVAVEIIRRYMKQNAKFRKLIMTLQQHHTCEGLDITAFLLTPVQRVPRYLLLMQQVFNHTDEKHPEAAATAHALSRLQELLEELDESIQNALASGQLSVANRKMTRQNKLIMVSSCDSLNRTSSATSLTNDETPILAIPDVSNSSEHGGASTFSVRGNSGSNGGLLSRIQHSLRRQSSCSPNGRVCHFYGEHFLLNRASEVQNLPLDDIHATQMTGQSSPICSRSIERGRSLNRRGIQRSDSLGHKVNANVAASASFQCSSESSNSQKHRLHESTSSVDPKTKPNCGPPVAISSRTFHHNKNIPWTSSKSENSSPIQGVGNVSYSIAPQPQIKTSRQKSLTKSSEKICKSVARSVSVGRASDHRIKHSAHIPYEQIAVQSDDDSRSTSGTNACFSSSSKNTIKHSFRNMFRRKSSKSSSNVSSRISPAAAAAAATDSNNKASIVCKGKSHFGTSV